MHLKVEYLQNINVFMNSYSQPENRLTFNFLWLVQYLNDAKFIKFLSKIDNISNLEPINNIKTVFGGGESNPDGALTIRLDNGDLFTIYIESKTYRREIDINQLKRHLRCHVKSNDVLLVITPRDSDREIIKNMNKSSIVFITWQDISSYLEENNNDDILVENFIEFGNITGEFTVMNDVETKDLDLLINWYKSKIYNRFETIFNSLALDIHDIFNGYNIKDETITVVNHYGRQGVEFHFKDSEYNLWFFFGLYYNEYDHLISFVNKDIPDIAFFIDLTHKGKNKDKIDNDNEIIKDFRNLEKFGFRCNDNGNLTKNRWRLVSYQKSLKDFNVISKDILKSELENILKIFTENSVCLINYM